jgi:hypothetical protein
MISGPSMLLAWLKLRRRNLGPVLDANGWAINGRARVNVAFGAAMTQLAAAAAGARRALDDPFADKRRPWKLYARGVSRPRRSPASGTSASSTTTCRPPPARSPSSASRHRLPWRPADPARLPPIAASPAPAGAAPPPATPQARATTPPAGLFRPPSCDFDTSAISRRCGLR